MARFGLDYAFGHLTAAQHKAVGSTFACRYLSGGGGKDLTAAEVSNLRAGGVDIVVVWETTASQALGGESAGQAVAKLALAEANRLGIPSHRPIYFAVDFDETPAQNVPVEAYFRGIVSELGVGRVGVYGDYYVVNRVFAAGNAKYGWQTYAWSGGQLSPHACLYQYSNGHTVAGVGVDYNRALAADFGQWAYAAAKPAAAKPVVEPHGQWKVLVTWDADKRTWSAEHQPGVGVKLGGSNDLHGIELRVNEKTGIWRVKGLPVVKA